jgi:hypothetical protein
MACVSCEIDLPLLPVSSHSAAFAVPAHAVKRIKHPSCGRQSAMLNESPRALVIYLSEI